MSQHDGWDSSDDATAWTLIVLAWVLGVVPWAWGVFAIVRALLGLWS